jgi:hypothetical protein
MWGQCPMLTQQHWGHTWAVLTSQRWEMQQHWRQQQLGSCHPLLEQQVGKWYHCWSVLTQVQVAGNARCLCWWCVACVGCPMVTYCCSRQSSFVAAGVLGGWGGIELQTRILIMWG